MEYNKRFVEFDAIKQAATESATGVVELATNAEALGTTNSVVLTPGNLNSRFLHGASTFAGMTGQTITHNLGHQNYKFLILQTASPAGFLGEVYAIKANNTTVIYNTGSATGAFEYLIFIHAA
ncbi:MAG: hypothetical protein WCY59_06015 [Anaerovoracaceae bacterium]